MRTLLLLALLGTPAAAPAADRPKAVRGRVLLDANGNGRIDPADTGVPDVWVSDGVNFARTGADGSYALAWGDDPLIPYKPAQVLAVSWPSGTWPVGRSFFARRSDLRPDETADFLLRGAKQALPFTFAHGTDPHDNACGGPGFRDDIARMDSAVAFALMTGDLGYAGRDGAEKMFESLQAATRTFPVPLFHAPGNHDVCDIHTANWSDQHPLAGYGPYTRYLGPIRYSFNYAGVHFVALDWARVADKGDLQTGVPDAAVAWLKRDLANQKPGTRTFVFMHHDYRADAAFWDVLVEHKVELVLAGHSHRNKEETIRGVPRLTTQNLCGPYRLVTVRENGHAIVNRCFAGHVAEHRHSYAGKCKMTLALDAFKGRRGDGSADLENWAVRGTHPLDGFAARELDLLAEVVPGTAKRFGVRLGTGPGATEVALTAGDELQVGAVRTSAVRGRADKLYRVRVVVEGGGCSCR